MAREEKHLLSGILRANTMASVCLRPEKDFHGTPTTRARGNMLIHLRSGGRGLLNGWKRMWEGGYKGEICQKFQALFL